MTVIVRSDRLFRPSPSPKLSRSRYWFLPFTESVKSILAAAPDRVPIELHVAPALMETSTPTVPTVFAIRTAPCVAPARAGSFAGTSPGNAAIVYGVFWNSTSVDAPVDLSAGEPPGVRVPVVSSVPSRCSPADRLGSHRKQPL